MATNLLAGFAGAAVELAIAVLIIDRVAASRRRRQWAFAYEAVSDRLAITFVDVMRILWIKFSEAAAAANSERMPYFEQLAHLHLTELRSNIEGFATTLDPLSHDLCRRVDRRVSWAIAQMIELPSGTIRQRELTGLMYETGQLVIGFLELGGGPRYQREVAAVDKALRDMPALPLDTSADDVFRQRLQAQAALLAVRPESQRPLSSIAQDIDNDLAIPYFLIDQHLLRLQVRGEPA